VGHYTVMGNTVDDSVGEAFDKVARMLELDRSGLKTKNNDTDAHGGKLVEDYAAQGHAHAYKFTEPMKKKKRKV
jgi:N6-L-threonylcarbamoyladenine synthase